MRSPRVSELENPEKGLKQHEDLTDYVDLTRLRTRKPREGIETAGSVFWHSAQYVSELENPEKGLKRVQMTTIEFDELKSQN